MADERIKCPNCGTENSVNDTFCKECGSKLTKTNEENCVNSNSANENITETNTENDKPIHNILKPVLKVITLFLIALGVIAGFLYHIYLEECKEPYSTTWTFADTTTNISTAYNDKYGVVNVDLTINQTIEPWQIDEMGRNSADIEITCTTYDGLKKVFEFKNITLKKGENLKGRYTMESATLKDYIMIKSLLKGEATISYPTPLDMDSKKRNQLKQTYYKKQEELRKADDALNAASALGGLMLLNAMF